MPIEFRCTQCEKLLRTPDESAGKKAKCPQCAAIVDVPASTPPAEAPAQESMPPGFEPQPPSSPLENSFGGASVPPHSYASAPAIETKLGIVALERRVVTFDEVFSRTWAIFQDGLGQFVVPGLVLWAVWLVMQIFGQIGSLVANASGDPAIIGIFSFANSVISVLVYAWMDLSIVSFMLRHARTGRATMSDFFNIGPHFLRAVGTRLLFGLILFVIIVACLAPGLIVLGLGAAANAQEAAIIGGLLAFVGGLVAVVICIILVYRYFLWLYFFFTVDRNQGVFEAMRSSGEFMQGNKLIVFLLLLVTGIVGGLFSCVTLSFGMILFMPYLGLLYTVIYLSATGQPIYQPPGQKYAR